MNRQEKQILAYRATQPVRSSERMPRWLELIEIAVLIVGPTLMIMIKIVFSR